MFHDPFRPLQKKAALCWLSNTWWAFTQRRTSSGCTCSCGLARTLSITQHHWLQALFTCTSALLAQSSLRECCSTKRTEKLCSHLRLSGWTGRVLNPGRQRIALRKQGVAYKSSPLQSKEKRGEANCADIQTSSSVLSRTSTCRVGFSPLPLPGCPKCTQNPPPEIPLSLKNRIGGNFELLCVRMCMHARVWRIGRLHYTGRNPRARWNN